MDLFYKTMIKGHLCFQTKFDFFLLFSKGSKDFSLNNTFIKMEFSNANL